MDRKAISILVFVMLACITSSAQNMKVNYENNMDSLSNFMLQYYRMQNVQSFHLTLRGDFNGKRAKIHKVTCNNGIFTERQLLEDFQHFILSDSIETLDFMAVPYGKDRIRIACFYPISYNTKLFEDTLYIDRMKILMETYTAGSDSETPLMAYTTGIPFNGGTWFCGLRESGVEPRLWYKKYGIDGYTFYMITLEEDTPPDEKSPIYEKIAKEGGYGSHIQN
jgi:hypothetical protein